MSDLDDINRLTSRLENARPNLDRFDRYFSGTQPLAFLSPEVKASAPNLFNLAINWPRLVVNSIEERLDVSGFRIAGQGTPDSSLWDVWQQNRMDEDSQLAHQDALVYGRSYALVWADGNGDPLISVESPRQVYVEHDPATRARTVGIKRWVAQSRGYATLYYPDRIARYVTRSNVVQTDPTQQPQPDFYVPATDWQLRDSITNALGVVPVVPLVNRRRILGSDGESELADVVPLADAINKLATDLMVSSEYHSMPRRWVTGLEIVEDEAGNPMQPFDSVAGRTWQAEAPETRFGQFPEADLSGFIGAINMLTHAIASIAGLPPHYIALTATDNPASADAIRSAEASLVARARRKMRAFGGSWEEVMSLAMQVRDGTSTPDLSRLETIWNDPETRTVAQQADAALKLVTAGIIPAQQAQEDLGYSPEAQERMRTMRRQDALDNLASALTKGTTS